MGQQLTSLNIGEPDKVKTLLAFMGLEALNRLKQGSYSEADLKKIAGPLISRLHPRVEPEGGGQGVLRGARRTAVQGQTDESENGRRPKLVARHDGESGHD